MSILLNCEGEPCPNPVLRCKRLLDEQTPAELQVVVDNTAAKENVSRFLASKGLRVDEPRQEKNLWIITARARSAAEATPVQTGQTAEAGLCPVCPPKILVFLTAETIGQGDAGLGTRLMTNFLKTLPELGEALWRIIMVNGAVRLATKANPAIDVLKQLEASGVSILVCGTCLEFFQLMADKDVGQVTNMLDVVTSQQIADKVITL